MLGRLGDDKLITMAAESADLGGDVAGAWRRELGSCRPLPLKRAPAAPVAGGGGSWSAEMPVRAYVVSVRQAAAPGRQGLLQPLLRRWQAGGVSHTVFLLPVAAAVVAHKWRFYRRLLLAELALFGAWVTLHFVMALTFQAGGRAGSIHWRIGWPSMTCAMRKSQGSSQVPPLPWPPPRRHLPPPSQDPGSRWLVPPAASASLAAPLPFLLLDLRAAAAYRSRWLAAPWGVLSVATYALQVHCGGAPHVSNARGGSGPAAAASRKGAAPLLPPPPPPHTHTHPSCPSGRLLIGLPAGAGGALAACGGGSAGGAPAAAPAALHARVARLALLFPGRPGRPDERRGLLAACWRVTAAQGPGGNPRAALCPAQICTRPPLCTRRSPGRCSSWGC